MEDIERVQESLGLARSKREKWRLLHEESVKAKDTENPDLAARQIARFDRIIENYEALIAEPGRYQSN